MNINDERKAVVLIHDLMGIALRMSSHIPFASPVHDEISKLVKRTLELKPYVEFFHRTETIQETRPSVADRRTDPAIAQRATD